MCVQQQLQTLSSIQLLSTASAFNSVCVQHHLCSAASAFNVQQHLRSAASAFNSICIVHSGKELHLPVLHTIMYSGISKGMLNQQRHLRCAGWQGAGPSCLLWGRRQRSSAAQHWCPQSVLRCGHPGLSRSQLPNCVGAAQVLP